TSAAWQAAESCSSFPVGRCRHSISSSSTESAPSLGSELRLRADAGRGWRHDDRRFRAFLKRIHLVAVGDSHQNACAVQPSLVPGAPSGARSLAGASTTTRSRPDCLALYMAVSATL